MRSDNGPLSQSGIARGRRRTRVEWKGQTRGGGIDAIVGQQQQALDHIAQLAHIARPSVALQFGVSLWRDFSRLPIVLLGYGLSEEIHQEPNIFAAFAQGRQGDRKDEDAMVQVLAELAFANQFLQIPVRGHDHADIHGDGAITADSLHFFLLQNAQQFGLHQWGHVADFVQEKRPAVRLFEFARVPRDRSSECALFVPE